MPLERVERKYPEPDTWSMPVITVQSSPMSVEKKREAAKAMTEDLSRISGIPAEKITVLFQELPVENISTGGVLLSDARKA